MNNFYFILPTLVPMSSSGWLLWRCRRVVGRSTTTEFWVSQQLAKDPVLPTIETTIARASPFYCGATHTQTHCTTCSTSRYGIDKLCFVLFSLRSLTRCVLSNSTTPVVQKAVFVMRLQMRVVFLLLSSHRTCACVSVCRAPPAKKKK